MASQLYQVRNLYRDLKLDGFVLRAGKKARVRIEIDRTQDGQFHATARLVDAGGRVIGEADGMNAILAFEAAVQKLYNTHFNFVARISDEERGGGQ